MKASDFIKHLQHMIEIHGDLPLAVLEANDYDNGCSYIEVDSIEGVYNLLDDEVLYNKDDQEVKCATSVFLID